MFSRYSLIPTALLALLDVVSTSPVHHEKRQNDLFAVAGVQGGVQRRLEIRDMQGNADMWNLFLAAVQEWQAVDQADKLSYFQVAGIHGQPLVDWDGVRSTGDPGTGYCPHSSNMFALWHRPYLSLVEMMIQQHATGIANALPDGEAKARFQGVAQQLRLPYWDWAIQPNGGPIVPASVTSETIDITYPNGTRANIPNPLFQYTFHPLNPNDFGAPFNAWAHTTRNPPDLNDPNGASNQTRTEENLVNDLNNRRSSLYRILSQRQEFDLFSNHGSGDSPIGNLEGIHDGVHAAFGGHMLYLSNSAFDFAFWLHHSNVDRLIAIYQSLYPDTYVQSRTQGGATYTIAKDSQQDANSPLQPMHRSTNGDFWTSESARDITQFSYTYPDLADNPSHDVLIGRMNSLYNGGQAAGSKVKRTINYLQSDKQPNAKPMTYLAAIRAPLHALGGPYSIRVFIGDTTKQAGNWKADKVYAGSVYVMSKKGMTVDDKDESYVTGSVALDQKIDDDFADGLLDSFGQDAVLGYLKRTLRVKVEQNGQEVDRSKLKGLRVSVFSTEVKPPTSQKEFPSWVGLQEHDDINDGLEKWGWKSS